MAAKSYGSGSHSKEALSLYVLGKTIVRNWFPRIVTDTPIVE